ncbi:hypothetical protein DACRYDRAFT_92476, partial [Dacryopinax primogenitus]
MHLLTTTSMFISLPNDCWYQVLGPPIHELIVRGLPIAPSKPLNNSSSNMEPEAGPSTILNGKKRRSPTDIQLVRARIFYAKPSRAPDGKIRAGLPRFHVLNDLRHDHRSENAARHALKYIFPSEYGLHNVFTSPLDRLNPAFAFKDYTDRNDEIVAHGKMKTPKRLKQAMPLSSKLLALHCQTSYKRLCDTACPSKVLNNKADLSDASVILDIMSEISQ